jgi:small GTP-binding protein
MTVDAGEFKVVIIGATSVGKTCIVKRSTTGIFDSAAMPTLGASYTSKLVTVNEKVVRLLTWDTAGQERYRGITPMYYRNAAAALIVYSIVDVESFQQVDVWLRSLRENILTSIVLFVVGNKSDLDATRQVSVDEAQEKATAIGAHFSEVSAKTGDGIDELFVLVAAGCLEAHEGKAKGSDQNVAETVQVDGKKPNGGRCC